MAKNYKTFKKQKWLYFALSIVTYFLPFIIVTAIFLPFLKDVENGKKIAIGIVIIAINSIPFLMGIFHAFFAHFPMLNMVAIIFILLGLFFTVDVFRTCADTLMWIELAAVVGSIGSCIFWGLYRKYKAYAISVSATIKSKAFVQNGGGNP